MKKVALSVLGWTFFLTSATLAIADGTTAPPKAYEAAVAALDTFVRQQVADKNLPALSIALVDDQQIIWAKGYGFQDRDKKTVASAETVYRVGSVSKLFTDLAVMKLVEEGKLDLDAPVTKYLPDFKPTNPFDKPITLRMMMSHRSGLVREPPAGNYFDPTNPSLAKMVESLNPTTLVYSPEARIKYSNAAIATVGYVLEKTQGKAFSPFLQQALLEPLGMKRSSFEPKPELTKDLAAAVMWSYHGREFLAPTFELGMAPAGCMYSTVTDLGRFLSVVFAEGKGPNGVIAKPETLKTMLTPQYAKATDKEGFGIGFHITDLDGRKKIGHGGAIYGFATELAALPEDKLGVVVAASRDVANAVTTRIADVALKQMLAVKQKKPLPKIEETKPLDPKVTRELAGRWQAGEKAIELYERAGRLWVIPARGGMRMELRTLGDDLIVDDVVDFGLRIKRDGDKLVVNKDVYQRVESKKPEPPPEKWLGLIGEYGWDHNTLYILERDGKLQALIEWVFLYPLTEVDKDVFAFPDFGLYHGEKLIFKRDGSGLASQVEAASVVFKRRPLPGEDGKPFRIIPVRPLDELRKEALAAKPPEEKGDFRKPELVDLARLDETIKLDVRYAGDDNFVGTPFYPAGSRSFLQKPAAEALVRAHRKLGDQGYGLMIHDGYRPWYVTKMFWEATPAKDRIFVADPSKGSRHNRGCAVDLTLYDRKTGKAVDMPGGYDEFSDRSYPDYLGGTSQQRWLRDLLRRTMETEGFSVYEAEWWHFDYKDWRSYPIQNVLFDQLGGGKRR